MRVPISKTINNNSEHLKYFYIELSGDSILLKIIILATWIKIFYLISNLLNNKLIINFI